MKPVSKNRDPERSKSGNLYSGTGKIQDLSWMFEYPFDSSESMKGIYTTKNAERF